MASKFFAEVNRKRCVSCGACTRECPRGAIRVWKGRYSIVDPLLSIGCGKCKQTCPADCIELKLREGGA